MNITELNHYFKYYEDITKFRLGKTYKYDLVQKYINLYYDNKKILVQSPAMFIPYKPHLNTYLKTNKKRILDASFFNEGIDSDVELFEEWLYKLEKIVYKLLRKRTYLKASKYGYNTFFKSDTYRKTKKISLPLNTENVPMFIMNDYKDTIDNISLNDVLFPCYAFLIYEIKTIWIRNDSTSAYPSWGIKLDIQAIKFIPNHVLNIPVIDKTNMTFIESKTLKPLPNNNVPPPPPPPPPPLPNSSNIPEVDETLKKFVKMLKLGIPREAVRHKMKMVGVDPKLLDNPYINNNSNNNANVSGNSIKITATMLQSVKLKNNRDNTIKPHKKTQSSGFVVNLDDILNIRNNLKKTGKNTSKKLETDINKDYNKDYNYDNDLSD